MNAADEITILNKRKYTRTMTALLVPDSPRITSYLWLTHLAHSQQLYFVVNEYLNLRRASLVAQCDGDIEKAIAHLKPKGQQRVRRHFSEFVQRFIETYNLDHDAATEVALSYGRMCDWFLVEPEEAPGQRVEQVHGVVNQLTQVQPANKQTADHYGCCKGWPDEIRDSLIGLHQRGIVLFDRKAHLQIGSNVHLQRMNKLFCIAAACLRSSSELQKLREQVIDKWEDERRDFQAQHEDWFENRYPFFDAYEAERTELHQMVLEETQPGRKAKPFHIRGANIKGINRIRNEWREAGLWGSENPEPADRQARAGKRLEILQAIRDADNELFGDHRVFDWLAEHADDWPGFEQDFDKLLDYNSQYLPDRRPKSIGFSQPDAFKHPVWYELEERTSSTASNREKQYIPDLENLTLTMMLVVPRQDTTTERNSVRWDPASAGRGMLSDTETTSILADLRNQAELVQVPVRFRPDRRVTGRISTNPEGPFKQGNETYNYLYADPDYGDKLPIKLGGMKLVFAPRPVRQSRSRPYAYFSTVTLVPGPERLKLGKGIADLPAGTRIMAVDLGLRHTAFAVIREYDGEDPAGRQVWAGSLKAGGGRHLRRVMMLEKTMSRKRSEATRDVDREGRAIQRVLSRDVIFDAGLRDHITNLKDDIAKQTAAVILKTAVEHGVRVILFERLQDYKTSSGRSRRENRRLTTMALRNLIQQVGQSKTAGGKFAGVARAEYYGIQVWDVIPAWTSHTCHRCGSGGIRYRELTENWFYDREGNRLGSRKHKGTLISRDMVGAALISTGGPLFCCANPDCDVVKINADYNGAQNIYRRFARLPMVAAPKTGTKKSREFWAQVERDVREKLRSRGLALADEGGASTGSTG